MSTSKQIVSGRQDRMARSIVGLSEIHRAPRLGKIHLGVKKVSGRSNKEYPSATEYFVCPPEVVQVYDDKPKVLDVVFAHESREVVFQQALKAYGLSGLKCRGDGQVAFRLTNKGTEKNPEFDWVERECPCPWIDTKSPENPEGGQCARRAALQVVLPLVDPSGVYQIDTGSYNSIVNINSALRDFAKLMNLPEGTVPTWVPFTLCLEPMEAQVEGSRKVVFVMQLRMGRLTPEQFAESPTGRWLRSIRNIRQVTIALPEPRKESDVIEGAAFDEDAEARLNQKDREDELRNAAKERRDAHVRSEDGKGIEIVSLEDNPYAGSEEAPNAGGSAGDEKGGDDGGPKPQPAVHGSGPQGDRPARSKGGRSASGDGEGGGRGSSGGRKSSGGKDEGKRGAGEKTGGRRGGSPEGGATIPTEEQQAGIDTLKNPLQRKVAELAWGCGLLSAAGLSIDIDQEFEKQFGTPSGEEFPIENWGQPALQRIAAYLLKRAAREAS